MAILKQSTSYTRMFLMVLASDHLSAATGLTPVVSISKAGAAFGAPSGGANATEVANGWYKIALSATDTNTLGDLAFHAAVATADPTDLGDQVFANIPGDSVNVASINAISTSGVTAVNAVQGTSVAIAVDSFGNVSTTANIKKNTATTGFMFVMTNSTTHAPMTGLSVTATRSIDGAGFSSTTNSVTEVANGTYAINLSAADVNGNHIMLRFTAASADDLNIEIITQP